MKTLMLTGPIGLLLLGPGGAAAADEAAHRADAPVRMELMAHDARAASVAIPAVAQLEGRTFSATTRPGPTAEYWGGVFHLSVGLPQRLGRVEWSFGKSALADQVSRSYSESPIILASGSGDTGSSISDSAGREFEPSFFSLGWSKRVWSRRGWAVSGEASLRLATSRRIVSDRLTGPSLSPYGERYGAVVEKSYGGMRAGFVVSAPLAGSASLEAAVGGFLATVSESCGGCSSNERTGYGDRGYEVGPLGDSRTELVPDMTLRLRIPLSARLELSGGYRWESWGEDVFGRLGLSGRFFSLTILLGRGKR